MTPDLILALVLFAFASSITPGPNNIMLLPQARNFGLRRRCRISWASRFGHAVMVSLVGLGPCSASSRAGHGQDALMVAARDYLLFLALENRQLSAPPADASSGCAAFKASWQAAAFRG